ncbi:MAG: transporter [Elusimicrobia bacterium]|nr:transporter [Elusimicrobiota bacterium]
MISRRSLGNLVRKGVVVIGLGTHAICLWAFNQPPLNMSATTFLDGGAPQGVYYLNYSIFVDGNEPLDKDGNVIPGGARVNALTNMHQLYYHSPLSLLGGDAGFMVALPVVGLSAKGSLGPNPLVADTAGVGDFVFGPALHWDGKTLFGQPVFYRAELTITLPTGRYSNDGKLDVGSNLTTYDPYASVVWFFRPKWETSWRFFYTAHSTNHDYGEGTLRPGQAFHLNYAVSREVIPKWRLGMAGYYLQQLTEDTINGVKQMDSKERVMSAGPGFVYLGQGLTAIFSYPIEFSVENRFKGSRATLQLIHKF